MKKVKALALFSGGLDSILAARVIAAQGIEVVAVKFITPFFESDILADIEAYQAKILEKYSLKVIVEDISDGYLDLLHNPTHGFGKNFNPCIDCKIYMLSRAKEMMAELGASFLITGEVLGQRPMSQRRDTLNVIERDSGSKTQLLRPLSAKLMNPTQAELDGLVDREQLYNFSGRGRSRQIALAKEFGIEDYPAPAGGCILADPILSRRIKKVYDGDFVLSPKEITADDIRMMLVGRQLVLPGGGWLILGRDEKENIRMEKLVSDDDATFFMEERPGPYGVLRKAATCYADVSQQEADIKFAASLVVRYGKKVKTGPKGHDVGVSVGGQAYDIFAEPLEDKIFQSWIL